MGFVSGQGCPSYRENIKNPLSFASACAQSVQAQVRWLDKRAHLSPVVRVRLPPIGLGSIETWRSLLLHTPAVKAEVVGNF